jgi:hypothetical protein
VPKPVSELVGPLLGTLGVAVNPTGGQGLALDEFGKVPASVLPAAATVVYMKTTQKDVANTTTETDLLNDEITVAADVLGANGYIDAMFHGDLLNNVGATSNVTLRFKFGATTLWAETVVLSNITARASWALRFRLFNSGATNAQELSGMFVGGELNGAPTTGFGRITTVGGNAAPLGGFGGTAAEDTTSSKTLKLTVEWATASATRSFLLDTAHLVAFRIV